MPTAEMIPAPPPLPFYAPPQPDSSAQQPVSPPSEPPAAGSNGAVHVSSPAAPRLAAKSPAKAKSPGKSPAKAAKCPFCGNCECTCDGDAPAAAAPAGAASELTPSKLQKQRAAATPPAHAPTPPPAAAPPASSPPGSGAKRSLMAMSSPRKAVAATVGADNTDDVVFVEERMSPPKRQAVSVPPPQPQVDAPLPRGVATTLGGRVTSPLKPVPAAQRGGAAAAAPGSQPPDFRIAVEALDERAGGYRGFYLSAEDMRELGIRPEQVSAWVRSRQECGAGAGSGAQGKARKGGAAAANGWAPLQPPQKGGAGPARPKPALPAPRPAPVAAAAPAPAAPAVDEAKWTAALKRAFEMCFPGTRDECTLDAFKSSLSVGGLFGDEMQAFLDRYEGAVIVVDHTHGRVYKIC